MTSHHSPPKKKELCYHFFLFSLCSKFHKLLHVADKLLQQFLSQENSFFTARKSAGKWQTICLVENILVFKLADSLRGKQSFWYPKCSWSCLDRDCMWSLNDLGISLVGNFFTPFSAHVLPPLSCRLVLLSFCQLVSDLYTFLDSCPFCCHHHCCRRCHQGINQGSLGGGGKGSWGSWGA